MKLMMVCPMCNGKREVDADCIYGLVPCPECYETGMIDPPQQILDDLECAEIERELLDKGYGTRIFKSVRFNEIGMNVYDPDKTLGITARGATKLEALRKAKAWLDGRYAE